MVAEAFWLRPDWLGDSRDNPRDPGFEPFWMRGPRDADAQGCKQMSSVMDRKLRIINMYANAVRIVS